MNLETLQTFFGYCTLIGYGVLLLWTVVFRFAHDWHFGMAKGWFKTATVEAYDMVNFAGIAAFKLAIVLFFLIPFISIWLIAK